MLWKLCRAPNLQQWPSGSGWRSAEYPSSALSSTPKSHAAGGHGRHRSDQAAAAEECTRSRPPYVDMLDDSPRSATAERPMSTAGTNRRVLRSGCHGAAAASASMEDGNSDSGGQVSVQAYSMVCSWLPLLPVPAKKKYKTCCKWLANLIFRACRWPWKSFGQAISPTSLFTQTRWRSAML